MGTDKASICYHGNQPEWQRLMHLLEDRCDAAFLCHRDDQDFGRDAIIDPGEGPLAAIATAQATHPDAAWLVIACDLPLINGETLDYLIEQRETEKVATCYASVLDGIAEPLCAIYEPSINSCVSRSIDHGCYCPRDVLQGAKLVELPEKQRLMNSNSPADVLEIKSFIEGTRNSKPVSVEYFAQFKEITGIEYEERNTEAVTASGLYEELKAQYQFSQKQKQLMLAINDEFSPWETQLQGGDKIVFIPPVAGG